MSERLYRLTAGDEIVSDEFVRGESALDEERIERHVEETDVTADLSEIDATVDEVLSSHDVGDAKIDRDLAPTVHRNLQLTRRQASEREIWHYLATVWRPDFVRHRWPWDAPKRTLNSMREKFLAAGRDVYSNAFGRLWWVAELTYDPDTDDYDYTRAAFDNQELVNDIVDRSYSRHRGAARASVAVLRDDPESVIRPTLRDFNHALSTLTAEAQTQKELQRAVERIAERYRGEESD